MSNSKAKLDSSMVSFREVWSLLWERLGSSRLLLIVAMLLGIGEAIIMMLFPVIVDIYFNQMELQNFEVIQQLLVVCTVIFFSVTLVSLLSEYLKQITTTQLNMDITLKLADEAQRLPLERATATHSSDLVQRVTHDTKGLIWLLSLVLDKMGNQVLIFLMAAAYMIWLNWQIAIVVLIVTPLILISSHLLRHHLRRIGHQIAEQEAIVRQCQQDMLQAMETIKAYGIGDWMKKRFVREKEHLNKLYMSRMWWQQAVTATSASLTHLVIFVTLFVVAWLAIQGSMNMGALMAFFILIWRISSPLQNIASQWGEIQGILGSAVRILALWRVEKEPHKRVELVSTGEESSLSWQAVSFAYQENAALQAEDAYQQSDTAAASQAEDAKLLLDNFSLELPAGSFTALVGPSGSGKSTVAKIAAGLLFPNQGQFIFGDGLSPQENAELARQRIAYVPQSPYLFSGSIRQNLLSVRPTATEEELLEATQLAEAHSFIENLPDGYETKLSEHGNSLSGGQKQRLAIAIAIVADRPIWIFDEATSALDLETEKKVMSRLLARARERKSTFLVVAHRLATVQEADRIIVMEKGIIHQQGKHEELLKAKKGLYQQMMGVV